MTGLRIRPAVDADAGDLNEIYNHYVRHTHFTFDVAPWTTPERIHWIASFENNERHHLLVAESDGEILGFCCNGRFRPKAAYSLSTETTIYLHPDRALAGTGGALYQELFNRIATTDLHRAYAAIALPNDVSIRFHEKFGFQRTGVLREVGRKFDRFVDVAWYEKALSSP